MIMVVVGVLVVGVPPLLHRSPEVHENLNYKQTESSQSTGFVRVCIGMWGRTKEEEEEEEEAG